MVTNGRERSAKLPALRTFTVSRRPAMSDYLIVVVNRSQARFFVLEPVAHPELESGPRIVLRDELANPEIETGQAMYTDSKTGRGAAPTGGAVHGYEDKRHRHLDELRRRFAGAVVQRLQTLVEREQIRHIVLAASARMRCFLYPSLEAFSRAGIETHKVSKNMINFGPQKIHDQLAQAGLVPEQKRLVV
jgi:hypothetical protein